MKIKREGFAIQLRGVTKEYVLHHEKPTLMENLLGVTKSNQKFTALKNVSLSIKRGDRLGIIGPNGSGKTTLLKIISQITAPTVGKVEVRGKLVSLIDLEAGFHPELTGEENIYLNAMLLGMRREEVRKVMGEIIKFADIGQFIDSPLYTYSSGMKLRLGFSIAIYNNPDILVLDEMMSVGDQEFRERSRDRLHQMIKENRTILYASHDLKSFDSLCPKVVWLENGLIRQYGKTAEVIKNYLGTI